jgi:hypothetical protein
VVVEDSLCSYLLLYTLAKGCSKTLIIKELLQKWSATQKVNNPENLLLQDLIKRIGTEYSKAYLINPHLTLTQFKKEVKRELQKKGLKDKLIEQILKEV